MIAEPDKITYDDHGRHYHYKKRKYPSVTTTLHAMDVKKPWLKPAAERHVDRNPDYAWDDYTSDAMLSGTYLHYWIGNDLIDRTGIAQPRPEFEPERPIPDRTWYDKNFHERNRRTDYATMIQMWEDFARLTRPTIHAMGLERFVWHSTGYAGRVDCILKFDWQDLSGYAGHFNFTNGAPRPDDVWLVDIKSSRGIFDEYPSQVWAYYLAWNELQPPQGRANRMAIARFNAEMDWEFTEVSPKTLVNLNGQKITAVSYWNRALVCARKKQLIQS